MKSCDNTLENCFFFQILSYLRTYVPIIYEKTKEQISLRLHRENRAFSHNVTAAMLVFPTNLLGVKRFSYVNPSFGSN